jgi:nicotinate phosphoribosyltransferase
MNKYPQIITDLDDLDFYKITMLYVIFKKNPDVKTGWSFYNRGNHKFPKGFGTELRKQLDNFADLRFTPEMEKNLRRISNAVDGTPLFDESFYTFLRGFRYKPEQVKIEQIGDELSVDIKGLWTDTMFYETQIMATIVELNNLMKGHKYEQFNEEDLNKTDRVKFEQFRSMGVNIAEFGMRRRAFKANQDRVVKLAVTEYPDVFVGTSNVMFSRKYQCKAIGTTAHERTMVLATKYGPLQAYEEEMKSWVDCYQGSLGIALPDAFGTKKFLTKFNIFYSKLYDGLRQDSGDPKEFTDWVIDHYKSKGVDSTSKTIVFSDSINSVEKVKELSEYRKDEIKRSFGIGTWLVNDLPGIDTMNIVIKVSSAKFDEETGWKYCVKVGDGSGKYTYTDLDTLNEYLMELGIIIDESEEYEEPRYLEKDDYVFTLDDWFESVEDGGIMDDDGFGYYVKDNVILTSYEPSFYYDEEDKEEVKKKYTGVVWYNK